MKRIAEVQEALEAAQRTARRQSAPLYRVMTRATQKEREWKSTIVRGKQSHKSTADPTADPRGFNL
jgi:hypothetical protein